MEKIVIYQTNKSVGVQYKDDFRRYCYEKEIIPIRRGIFECTKEGVMAIYELFTTNQEAYIEELLACLECPTVYYSN